MTTMDELAKAGIQAINEDRFDDAIENLEKAVELGPDRPDIVNALGMCHLRRGEIGTALPLLEKSLELAEPYEGPEVQEMKCNFHIGMGTAYRLADQVADARAVLERAISRWPDRLEPRLQLGQILLESCLLDEGIAHYKELSEYPGLDAQQRKAMETLVEAIVAFQESEHPAGVFLQGHQESYRAYFDEVVAEEDKEGWYAEAARMAKGADGEMKPILSEGARPYALTRVDLVNPETGEIFGVYNEDEVMIVALRGLEPLAQVPILFPWEGHPFEVWVCSQAPWHWLTITVQFDDPAADEDALIDRIDPTIAEWYLAGYNGDFGDTGSGRFHYVTDPEVIGDRAVAYTFDLGRATYQAAETLMARLLILHEHHTLRRVVFGRGRLPD